MTLDIGSAAPDFTMPANGGNTVSLSDYKGQYLVLYFYPKDNTPGCTKQAIGFTEQKAAFEALGAKILGVSKDSAEKHDKFIAKQELSIDLGADEAGETIEAYGVWVEKNMYGKKFMGIERATYLIGPDGKILEIWRKVRVKDHIEKVLTSLKTHIG